MALAVGDAMIYAQVNAPTFIGSPTSEEVGHPFVDGPSDQE